jgi:hypothetical protein
MWWYCERVGECRSVDCWTCACRVATACVSCDSCVRSV